MTTPSVDEIREKAIGLFMQDSPCCTNTPEDYELKEGGYWENAKILLMKADSPEFEEDLEQHYQMLVNDCIEIVKKIRKASSDVVRYWHELGTRILEDDIYICGKWGSGVFVKRLAEDIGVNKSAIYHAIRFAKEFPDLEKCLTDKKFSASTWSYIVHNVLYESKPKPKLKPKLKPSVEPAVTKMKPLSYLKNLSYIDEVPCVDEAKQEFDIMAIMDELQRIVDKTKSQPVTRVYFSGASWGLHLDIRHYNSSQETESCPKVEIH